MPSAEELAGYAYLAGTEQDDNNGVFKGSNGVSSWFQGLGGDDQINGNNLADLIEGGAGNDTLHGNDGDDLLLGGVGNDDIRATTARIASKAAPATMRSAAATTATICMAVPAMT